MCGIFGASLNPRIMDKGMTKAAIAKFKMLGMYNVDRGKHSCGVYMDSMISKGIDKDKIFHDFIQAHHLPDPSDTGNYTMIGHTRMATHGSHTLENAHPFIIDDEFVLAHNGVIRNIWTLCNKYKIDHSKIHVDSMGLAALINKVGFSILNEYEGFAALLMARQSEPNSLYVYRGVSKRYSTGAEEEERPLFYLQCEEGIYFSSLERSLMAISDSGNDKLKLLEGNIVHKITNGVITKSKFPVSRDTVNYGVNAQTFGGSPAQNYPKPQGATPLALKMIGSTTTAPSTQNSSSATNSHVGRTLNASLFEKNITPVIWYETLPKRVDKYAGKKGIIYHVGRYWTVENEELKIAHGSYYINKRGFITMNKIKTSHNWFFYQGVMMKSLSAYNAALADDALKNIFWNYSVHISKYADYPVSNSRMEIATGCRDVSDYFKHRWFLNGNMCTNTGFTPKFSDRNYIIKDGLMHSISVQKGAVAEPCIDKELMQIDRNKGIIKEVESGIPPTLPEVVVPTDDLPFTEPRFMIDPNPSKAIPEWDVTHFYQPMESLEDYHATFTELEMNAVRYYIADLMMNELGLFPANIKEDMVEVQLNLFLSECVENRTNVIDQWNEKEYKDILDYMLIAQDNPKGDIFDDADVSDATEINEACEFIPKPVVDSQTSLAPIEERIDALNNMVQDYQKKVDEHNLSIVVNNISNPVKPSQDKLYIAEDKDGPNYQDAMDNGLTIDEIVRREEQARVPERKEDEESDFYVNEEHTKQDEIDYAFQDIVDDLSGAITCADELQEHEDSDFAQEVANLIYRAIDPALRDLRELSAKHGEVDMERYVIDVIKKKVNV